MAFVSMASSLPNHILPRAASNGSLGAGEIAGLVIGGISAFLALAVAAFLLYRRRRIRRIAPRSLTAESSEVVHVTGLALAPHTQPSVAGPSRPSPAQKEKPGVVDEKRILGLDDASYLSRLPEQQGQYISRYEQISASD